MVLCTKSSVDWEASGCGEMKCSQDHHTHKVLSLQTFWMLLNAMVLSVCLADESELSDGLKRG